MIECWIASPVTLGNAQKITEKWIASQEFPGHSFGSTFTAAPEHFLFQEQQDAILRDYQLHFNV